uniref:Apple domain-containing protein n=1 Tax=Trichuris muris TaxID=70415 RepID=A0A5S6QTM9_TRIMR
MLASCGIVALLCLQFVPGSLSYLCPAPSKEAFVKTEGMHFPGGSGKRRTVSSTEECVSACRLDPGCASINYYTESNQCEIMTTATNSGTELEEKSGVAFYQKICVDALGACLTSFNRLPQTQFIGWARDVARGVTLQACLGKCLNTKQGTAGYTCMSIMYYYQDSECVLNAESIEHYPQLAQKSDASKGYVDYFTNNCIGEWGPWSDWTECQENGLQIRSRACTPFGACSGDAIEERQCVHHHPEQPSPPPRRPCCQSPRPPPPCCGYNQVTPARNVFVPLNPA